MFILEIYKTKMSTPTAYREETRSYMFIDSHLCEGILAVILRPRIPRIEDITF